MDLDQYYDKIEAYLGNALSAAEQADFEAQIKAQPALKRAVLNHVLANEALGLAIEDKVASKLERLAQNRKAKENPKPLNVWWQQPLLVAAGMLFLVFASLAILANQNYTNQALASQKYAQSTLPTTRSEAADHPDFMKGMLAFREKEYSSAIAFLSKIPTDNSSYLSAQYLLGHSYLKTSNFKKAITAFDKILVSNISTPTIDRQEVEWNKLMAILTSKGADNPLFQKGLNAILANEQHAYNKAANELSKQINSAWRYLIWE